jgi:hypothetical protein
MAACAANRERGTTVRRHIEQKPLKCAGRVVMGIWDARRQAAESHILLVMAMDHVDPPVQPDHARVRIELAYGVVAGGERDVGNPPGRMA